MGNALPPKWFKHEHRKCLNWNDCKPAIQVYFHYWKIFWTSVYLQEELIWSCITIKLCWQRQQHQKQHLQQYLHQQQWHHQQQQQQHDFWTHKQKINIEGDQYPIYWYRYRYVAGNWGNQAFPEMPSQLGKFLYCLGSCGNSRHFRICLGNWGKYYFFKKLKILGNSTTLKVQLKKVV